MSKLTDTQIETLITEAHADILAVAEVSSDSRVIDPCITRQLRACFSAGADHGQATMLERAAELVPAVDLEHAALGRALLTVLRWVACAPGRSWSTGKDYAVAYLSKEFDAPAKTVLADSPEFYHFVYSENTQCAIVRLATWCTEHAETFPPRSRDTEPAPAMAPSIAPSIVGGDCVGIELRSPAIGGSHSPELTPDTERNL